MQTLCRVEERDGDAHALEVELLEVVELRFVRGVPVVDDTYARIADVGVVELIMGKRTHDVVCKGEVHLMDEFFHGEFGEKIVDEDGFVGLGGTGPEWVSYEDIVRAGIVESIESPRRPQRQDHSEGAEQHVVESVTCY